MQTFSLIIYFVSYPSHPVTAGFDDDAADGLQQFLFILCMNQRFVAMVADNKCTSQPLKFSFSMFSFGDVMSNDMNNGFPIQLYLVAIDLYIPDRAVGPPVASDEFIVLSGFYGLQAFDNLLLRKSIDVPGIHLPEFFS